MEDIKQAIIDLVNEIDDQRALRIIYSYLRGLLEGLKRRSPKEL